MCSPLHSNRQHAKVRCDGANVCVATIDGCLLCCVPSGSPCVLPTRTRASRHIEQVFPYLMPRQSEEKTKGKFFVAQIEFTTFGVSSLVPPASGSLEGSVTELEVSPGFWVTAFGV